MKLIRFPFLLVIALLVAACASTGGSGSGPSKVAIGNISNLPQVMLPGASMWDARSVAMAAARTKGWEITAADANRVVLERPLPPDSPQAQALGSAFSPPRIQVETDIVERGNGAIVALRAFVLANPGTKEERRIDYTSDYESQLLISLSSLSSAWLAAQDNVQSSVPVLAELEAQEDAEPSGGDLGDVAATVGGATGADTAATFQTTVGTDEPSAAGASPVPAPAYTAAPAGPSPMREQAPTPPAPRRAAPAPQPSPALAAAPASPAAPSALVAPTIEPPASPRTAAEASMPTVLGTGPDTGGNFPAPAPIGPMETGAGNDMLVLSQASSKGLWAYYAEDYARLRGCALGDRGAVLLNQTDGFEVHEVECVRGTNVLVKCRGGVCELMR